MKLLHVIAKSMNGHHYTGHAVRQTNGGAKKFKEALISAVTDFGKQFTVFKVQPQNNRKAKYILAVGNRIEDIFLYLV